ncbi:hypothetical protein NEOLEDRAFT_1176348 [Neolentinus lepideus HHB14362 ss-1]|uniref:Uncharacterized protein n=1 Tax=Neolentinus lepideus HHB14362 ss-1 TaxID=1314782 RepID=A0A165U749_9AGAM|nr:hypothetical protein NEOLEDRAFT_1176348 [Neolentinus lepideus HHB14362 ss-1]
MAIIGQLAYQALVADHANLIGILTFSWNNVAQVAATITGDAIIRMIFTWKIWLREHDL